MGGSSQTIGWNYRLAWHDCLCLGPLDAFLEFRGADKVAWKGRMTSSGAAGVYKPKLWGGDKDQGGADGTLRVLFGEAGQLPPAYLTSVLSTRTGAWRGIATVVWEGGLWGANNPYQQKRAYRVERIVKGWDNDDCWYPAKAPVPIEGEFIPGSPGSGTYRWAFKMGGTPTLSPSPDGIDWSDPTTLPAAFYTAEVTFPAGDRLVSINAGGATKHADWTTPGTWITGPSAGAVSGLLNPYAMFLNGRTFVARGEAGHSISDNVTVGYEQREGATSFFLGNDDFVVRCRGGAAPTFFRSADSGETYVDGITIERSFDPSDADYAFDIYAGRASDSAYAVGGRDYHGKPVIFRSVDGFMSTPTRATLPPDLLGTIYELFRAPGLGWLAFMNNSGGGAGALLRSTDDAQSFQVVDLGVPVNFGQVYQGNVGFDARDGRVVIAAQTPDGGRIFQTDNYTAWNERPYVAAFGPATILCIAPYDPDTPPVYGRVAKNPAHMILFAHTQKWAGRQPRDSVDLVQLQAAADWYYARGFGLCTIRKRMEESPREFIRRIEKVAGCSFSQSFDDGLWHLDIANGEYVLDDLPVIADADVLSFKFTPTTQDDAVNSVSVQYFDPDRKEKIITTPTRAMGLIARFGEIHQTFEYPEIPIGRIALMVALRELLASITPGGLFELDVMPWLAKLRKNQYVRLQLPKRGIADMVCLVGEVKNGRLKSGAVKLSLGVDVYSLPQTVYGGIELGTDPRPPTAPAQLVDEVAFEAPYIDVVASMPPADFAALPGDAGYVVAAASNPGRMRNFTMLVAPDGGEYDEVDEGEFCPSCTLTGDIEPGLQIAIGYANARNMAAVQVGTVGTLNGELVRVDAIDLDAQTLNLGRGCGDTVPRKHDAGDTILFYQVANGYDRTQHISGETVQVKLLTNSVSEQLDEADAPPKDVTFADRLARPYPPADLKINGVSIFAVGTSTPGGGGGGGGGSVPPAPPAQGPGGGPASPVPGPNGGFPDDAPYRIPLPPVGGDVIDDGGFDTPGYPTGWTNADGTPLDSRWFVDADGKLHYQGVGSSKAYYYPARFSLPWQPVPRYAIPVGADVRTDIGVTAAIGCAWGVSTAGAGVAYEDISGLAEYVVETPVAHSFIYVPPGLVSGLMYVDQIAIVNFVPVLSVHSPSALVVNATFDNVTVQPEIIPMPTTPEALGNLDFSSGLTGWTKYPDLTGNPYEATIVASGGELSMTGNSLYHTTQYFINDTPLSLNDIGRYTLTDLQAWCDDPTTLRGFTQNGVVIGIAAKFGGVYTSVAYSGAYQRGDWTTIKAALRHPADGTSTPGITLHEVIGMRVNPGYTAKVRNINAATTDDIIDPVVP